jgi:hypothetical protein
MKIFSWNKLKDYCTAENYILGLLFLIIIGGACVATFFSLQMMDLLAFATK